MSFEKIVSKEIKRVYKKYGQKAVKVKLGSFGAHITAHNEDGLVAEYIAITPDGAINTFNKKHDKVVFEKEGINIKESASISAFFCMYFGCNGRKSPLGHFIIWPDGSHVYPESLVQGPIGGAYIDHYRVVVFKNGDTSVSNKEKYYLDIDWDNMRVEVIHPDRTIEWVDFTHPSKDGVIGPKYGYNTRIWRV